METKKVKPKKEKIYTYHTSHSYIHNVEGKYNMISQLYQIGVYCIINNNPSMQFSTTPDRLMKLEKRLIKDLEAGTISDLKFGMQIKVIQNNSLWEELK